MNNFQKGYLLAAFTGQTILFAVFLILKGNENLLPGMPVETFIKTND